LATPQVLPEVVPAQCVPWPLASLAQYEEPPHSETPFPPVASMVAIARPPKSLWLTVIPVSRM